MRIIINNRVKQGLVLALTVLLAACSTPPAAPPAGPAAVVTAPVDKGSADKVAPEPRALRLGLGNAHAQQGGAQGQQEVFFHGQGLSKVNAGSIN